MLNYSMNKDVSNIFRDVPISIPINSYTHNNYVESSMMDDALKTYLAINIFVNLFFNFDGDFLKRIIIWLVELK
jgi:hypothetical protein